MSDILTKHGPTRTLPLTAQILTARPVVLAEPPVPLYRYECGTCSDTGTHNAHPCPFCAQGVERHLDAIADEMSGYAETMSRLAARGRGQSQRYADVYQRWYACRIAYDNLELKFWLLKADDLEFEPEFSFWNEDDAPDPRYVGEAIPY